MDYRTHEVMQRLLAVDPREVLERIPDLAQAFDEAFTTVSTHQNLESVDALLYRIKGAETMMLILRRSLAMTEARP